MPYKRAYKKRFKRKPYRPGYRACGTMVLSDASKALMKVNKLKSLLNVEYKIHTLEALDTAITDAGTITNVSTLTQGDTNITRDGSSVKFTSFRLSYGFKIGDSATRTNVRVMIVHDKQTNQAQFALADLLQNATVNDAIYSPLNIDNVSRFNVLYDKVHTLSSSGHTSVIHRTVNRKLNMKTRYDGNAGTVADLPSDSMSLVWIGDEVTNDPTRSFSYRSRFIDN